MLFSRMIIYILCIAFFDMGGSQCLMMVFTEYNAVLDCTILLNDEELCRLSFECVALNV